jgi:hypothetical protein
LPWLARATRELAHLTGCVQVDLVAHVLADTPLHRPAYRMSSHSSILRGRERYRHVVIEVRAPMTYAQDRACQRQIRQLFDRQKMKALTQDDQEFLTMIDAAIQAHNGQLPQGRGSGAAAFWDRVAQQWNTRRGQRVYRDWNGPKRRYTRLQAR